MKTLFLTARQAALTIIAAEKELRDATPRTGGFKVLTMAELANLPPRWSAPREKALRGWAKTVAPTLSYKEWDDIVWYCHDNTPGFRGDVIRFFENAFEGLVLKDGTSIYP